MLLTSEMLREKSACSHWQSVFDYRFPEGLRLETKEDLESVIRFGGMGPVLDWFAEQFEDYISHLKGHNGKIDLTNCCFDRAHLTGSNFSGIDFSGSSFRGSDLKHSLIKYCLFTGCDMRFSVMHSCRIYNSIGLMKPVL